MTAASDADRAKAAEIVAGELDNVGAFDHSNDEARDREYVLDVLAAALAAERAAVVEQITAAVLGLAEELEGESGQYVRDARPMPPDSLARKYLTGRVTSLQSAAARLRAAVADAGKPDTSSEEE